MKYWQLFGWCGIWILYKVILKERWEDLTGLIYRNCDLRLFLNIHVLFVPFQRSENINFLENIIGLQIWRLKVIIQLLNQTWIRFMIREKHKIHWFLMENIRVELIGTKTRFLDFFSKYIPVEIHWTRDDLFVFYLPWVFCVDETVPKSMTQTCHVWVNY